MYLDLWIFKKMYLHLPIPQEYTLLFYTVGCLTVLVAQSCLAIWSPTNCSPPGSSVQGVLQARTLEWVAVPFSRESSQPGIKPTSQIHLQVNSLLSEPPGCPL